MVYQERDEVIFKTQLSKLESSRLEHSLLEQQYESFLLWWKENYPSFSTLSFNIENQSQEFIKDLNNGVDLQTAILEIDSNLLGYYLEYIRQEAILPFTNRFKNGRLVGDFYGDKPIVDLVDEREREGAVLEAMIDLEEKLKTLTPNAPNEFILRVSPPGWTGLGYQYTESQFQIFWRKDKESIRGLTIRTKADLSRILSLLEKFGISFSATLDEKELIKAVTRCNIVVKNKSLENKSLDELINLIADISDGFDHQGRKLLPQYQRWKEFDGDYQRYDQLISILEFLEKRLSSLVKKGQEIDIRELKSLLAFALTVMAEKERWEKEGRLPYQFLITTDTYYPPIDPSGAVAYLQRLPGCGGGGGGSFSSYWVGGGPFSSDWGVYSWRIYPGPSGYFVLTPFGSLGVEILNKEGTQSELVTCPNCNRKVVASIIIEDGKQFILCPYCGVRSEIN